MEITGDLSLPLPRAVRESERCVPTSESNSRQRDAWQAVWDASAGELAGLVRALGINPDRRDDVLQDVYLVLRQKAPAGLTGDDARRWLFRVAANRCRLEHRGRARWLRLWSRLSQWRTELTAKGETSRPEQDELSSEVDRALGRLRPVEREVVVLRYFCGFNSREVGEVLAMPEATVRSHLAKARRQLAHDLAEFNDVGE